MYILTAKGISNEWNNKMKEETNHFKDIISLVGIICLFICLVMIPITIWKGFSIFGIKVFSTSLFIFTIIIYYIGFTERQKRQEDKPEPSKFQSKMSDMMKKAEDQTKDKR